MSVGNATASGAMGSTLWAQVAQPSVLVHSVVPAMTRMTLPTTTAWRYGLVASPLVDRQQSRQVDPSVMRSRDPVGPADRAADRAADRVRGDGRRDPG